MAATKEKLVELAGRYAYEIVDNFDWIVDFDNDREDIMYALLDCPSVVEYLHQIEELDRMYGENMFHNIAQLLAYMYKAEGRFDSDYLELKEDTKRFFGLEGVN